MPNLKSAKKELRKSVKRQLHNTEIKDNVKKLIKVSKKAILAKEAAAQEMVAKTLKALDKARQKGILKKNTANRKKSRLHKKLNASLKK